MQHKRPQRAGLVMLVGLLLVLALATTGCGGSPQSQQQATQSKAKLDSTLQHAKDIGVPASSLQPIMSKEQKLSSTSAPFTLFDDSSDTSYYLSQANNYNQLLAQLQDIVTNTTGDASTKAQLNMQSFQEALAKAQNLKTNNISVFTDEYARDQNLMAAAQTPKQYYAISDDASNAASALTLLSSSYAQLLTFNSTIKQMQTAHIDVGLMPTQYQSDLGTLNSITKPAD